MNGHTIQASKPETTSYETLYEECVFAASGNTSLVPVVPYHESLWRRGNSSDLILYIRAKRIREP